MITSGELPPNPAEMLGSQRMKQMLEQLREEADVVLIDSPPILPVTDAAVLAQGVDGVLLMVEAGETTREALQQAVDSLRQVEANVIGAALNRIPSGGGGYYYYYYRHYDAYYSEDGKKRKRRRKKGPLAGVRRALERTLRR